MRKYLNKKWKQKSKKVMYLSRKRVAEKRLRVKGRFMTKEKALKMLGLTSNDLLAQEKIQELLTQHSQQAIELDTLF